jgi:hypothetical protein
MFKLVLQSRRMRALVRASQERKANTDWLAVNHLTRGALFTARGVAPLYIAKAWSVADVLRAWARAEPSGRTSRPSATAPPRAARTARRVLAQRR